MSQESASNLQDLVAKPDIDRNDFRQSLDVEEQEQQSLHVQLSKMWEAMENLKREQELSVQQLQSEKGALACELANSNKKCQEMAEINNELSTEKGRLEKINAIQGKELFDSRTKLGELEENLETRYSNVNKLRKEYEMEVTALRKSLRECEERLESRVSKAQREKSVAETIEQSLREDLGKASERENDLNNSLQEYEGKLEAIVSKAEHEKSVADTTR